MKTNQKNKYKIEGPYRIPYAKRSSKFIEGVHTKEFWNIKEVRQLKDRKGCYVFGLQPRRGAGLPYYVGKTQKCFEKEVFNSDNLQKYNLILNKSVVGPPFMFFIVYPQGKKGKPNGTEIKEIETFLIQLERMRNKKHENKKEAGEPSWSIIGFTSGKSSERAQQFRKIMGQERHRRN